MTSKIVNNTIICVALLMVGRTPAFAQATYSVTDQQNHDFVGPCAGGTPLISSPTPLSVTLTCGPTGGSLVSTAVSGPGGHVGASMVNNGGDPVPAASFSTFITFTPTGPGPSLATIPVQLNLKVSGTLGLVAAPGACGSWEADAQIGVGGTIRRFSTAMCSDGSPAIHGANDLTFTSGGESIVVGVSDTVSGILTTPPVDIDVGVPVFVQFTLSLVGSGTTVNDLFLSSLDFPNGIDVFTLPAGYTANDTDGFLVNNRLPGSVAPLYHVCPLYDPTAAAKAGSTIPIKFQLCDVSGHDVSSSTIAVHATTITQISNSVSGPVQSSGNANPDNDFRFDSSLGSTGGYIFNLSTKGLTTGTYSVNFTVTGDSLTYSVQFQVK